jgi:hypothetical protein
MNTRLTVGLRLLLDAAHYARDAGKPPEAFAVELADLSAAGVLHIDVRWLLAKGYLTPVREAGRARRFKKDPFAPLSARARFVLTASGARLSRHLGNGSASAGRTRGRNGRNGHKSRVASRASKVVEPRWDPASRQLYFGATLVKQFLVPATNQEIILKTFQDLGWPECIDNPLGDGNETTARRRLHNAIIRLNHQQVHRLIRFHGTGTGDGVRWNAAP